MEQETKYIKIFLAMSEEDMGMELNELSDYIRSLNDLYIGRSIFFELCMPGETDADDIDGSQYFFLLFYRDADERIVEDFDIALKKFNASKTPKIVTYFKIAEEGSISEGVRSFMERLEKGLEHFYNKFDNIDTVKLSMLLEMARNQETKIDIEFQDGKILADKKEVEGISLDNIPQYFKNEALNKLREERLKLEEEYIKLRAAIKEEPDDDELFRKLYDVNERKNKADEQFHQMEMDILKMTSTIVEMTSDGKPLTVRAKKAIEYFNAGDYENCKDVLDDEERKRAWGRVGEKKAVIDEECEGLINEIRIKIDTIKAQGINNKSEKEIIELYEEAKEKIFEYNLNWTILLNYINFLQNQCFYYEGIKLGEQLVTISHLHQTKILEEYKILLFYLGHLYLETNNYDKAEMRLRQVLEMDLYDEEEKPYYIISDYCNMGILYEKMCKYDDAEKNYLKAIEYIEKSTNRNYFQTWSEAKVYDNLGNLYLKTGNMEKSEIAYIKAKELIQMEEEEGNIECARTNMIISINLGGLYLKKGYYESAQKEYENAKKICEELMEENRTHYLAEYIGICCGIGCVNGKLKNYDESVTWLNKGVNLYKEIERRNQGLCSEEFADIFNQLGTAYYFLKNYDKAEMAYSRALEMEKTLNKNGKNNVYGIIHVYKNLGNLYQETKKYLRAEKTYKEALLLKNSINDDKDIFLNKLLLEISIDMGSFYGKIKKFSEAEKHMYIALEKCQNINNQNKDAEKYYLKIIYKNLSILYRNMGKKRMARKFEKELSKLLK